MRAGYVYALAPAGVVDAVDHHGNVLIDGDDKVRVIAGRDGTFYGRPMTAGNVYTIAGTGAYGYSGDGGPATAADIVNTDEAVDAAGNLLIVDGYGPPRIRVVAAATGTFYGHPMTKGDIYTIAGGGTQSRQRRAATVGHVQLRRLAGRRSGRRHRRAGSRWPANPPDQPVTSPPDQA